MLEAESLWIRDVLLNRIGLENFRTVLNVGSGDLDYRTVRQPCIQCNVFDLLDGKDVKHLGTERGEGIDIVCDVKDFWWAVKEDFDLILCTNLLEHIERPIAAVRDLWERTEYLVLTVPHYYPYHPDPMDTMFRPSDEVLRRMVPSRHEVLDSRTLKIRKLYLRDRLYAFRRSWDLGLLYRWFEVSCLAVRKER